MITVVKYNYFENLEKLSLLSTSAVAAACTGEDADRISDIRRGCDRLVCETEDALFSDFLPPLERDNIAATAHTLSRVIDQACELISAPSVNAAFMRCNEEAVICVRLAEELSREISTLKRIRRPEQIPDLQGFRKLLTEGRCAHKRMVERLRCGALSKSYGEAIILTGRLRSELSRAFDELVEIMLNNI